MSGEGTGNAAEQFMLQPDQGAASSENIPMRGDVLSMPALADAFEAMRATPTEKAEKAMEEHGFPTADLFKEFLNQAEQINAETKAAKTDACAANSMPTPIEAESTFDASPPAEEQSRLI